MATSKERTPATASTVHRGPIVDCLGQTLNDSPPLKPVQCLTVVVCPMPGQPGHFAARLRGDRQILCASRSPFLDSARVLLARGAYDPLIQLEMLHDGAASPSLRAKLGVAANLIVEETALGPVFRSYRIALPSAVEAPRAPATEAAATLIANSARHGSNEDDRS